MRAPEGDHLRAARRARAARHSSSAADEKFAAHNAAVWEHGLLVVVPKGVELEQPLYVRIVNAIEGGALFWRLLVIAEEGAASR